MMNEEKRVYSASEIGIMLDMPRATVGRWLKRIYEGKDDSFHVKRIGKCYRIEKESFDNWLKQK